MQSGFFDTLRRSTKLRPHTDRYINLEIKNAEYHQQTFSDPLMILRMVEVAGFEPAAFWSRTKRATKLRYTSIKMEPIMGLEPMTC